MMISINNNDRSLNHKTNVPKVKKKVFTVHNQAAFSHSRHHQRIQMLTFGSTKSAATTATAAMRQRVL